ncbi:hypothetical protein CLOM_g5924 [Closterium sp. NIES-68]|nr:hypothetical protein CLOM_g5924 [Closterium sp. NIES-68]GJP63260.1 hypothetical protein CLOP_g20319 [Closterium sp. NIES-67]
MAPVRKKAEPSRKEESEIESASASGSESDNGSGSGSESGSERSERSDSGSEQGSGAEESGDEGSGTDGEDEEGSDEESERDARSESDVSEADGDEEEEKEAGKNGGEVSGGHERRGLLGAKKGKGAERAKGQELGKDEKVNRRRLTWLAWIGLWLGYLIAAFIAYHVMQAATSPVPISSHASSSSCFSSSSSYNETAAEGEEEDPAAHPGTVQSGNATCPAPPLPPFASILSAHPILAAAAAAAAAAADFALQPWTPAAATLAVLGFALLLLRQVSTAAKRRVALRETLKELEAEGASAGAGGEEEEGDGKESEGEGEGGSQDGGGRYGEREDWEGFVTSGGGGSQEPGFSEILAGIGESTGTNSLLAIIVNEVRVPLRGVLGLLQLLSASPLDAMQQDILHSVSATTRHLIHVANNVVDTWRADGRAAAAAAAAATAAVTTSTAGTGTGAPAAAAAAATADGTGGASGAVATVPVPPRLESALFEFRPLVDEVLALTGGEACEKGVEIAALVMDSVPLAVVGDPLRLRQILLNLFTIAVRLTDRGHIFLCVRVAFEPSQKPHAAAAAAAKTGAAGAGAGAGAGEKDKGRDHGERQEGDRGEGDGEEEKERAARGKTSLMKGEHLTLSGLPAVDGSNSWPAVCEMLKEQDSRVRKTPSGGAAAGAAAASGAAGAAGAGGGGSATAASASAAGAAGGRAVAERRRRGKRLLFSLEDTGAGLPDEVLAARERPFEAVHMKLQQKYAGVPLLLCFAEKLVESMSGQMSLSTRTSVGTTVTFDVLLDQPPPGAIPTSNAGGFAGGGGGGGGVGSGGSGGGGAGGGAAGAVGAAGGVVARVFHIGYGAIGDDQHAECAGLRAKLRGMRCLVVDGRPVRQQVTATYLARMGLRVDLSDSVPAAALALRHSRQLPGQGLVNRKSRWDMVVVDADADGPGTGIELGRMVQQLKDLREVWEATPIVPKLVLLTQTTNDDMEAEAARHGFSCIMLKPLRAATMATALLQALGLNPRETTALATRRRQLLLRLCLKAKRVLVVDHHYITRKAAAELVSHFADVVVAVDSAAEALSRLAPLPHAFQLILVNIRLADMPGFEFTEEVRRREAEHNKAEVQRWGATSAQRIHVPILGLVSDMHPEMVARWREVGMDGLLTSPIDEAQLLTVASRLFKPAEH